MQNSYTSSASSWHMGFDKNKLVLLERWRLCQTLTRYSPLHIQRREVSYYQGLSLNDEMLSPGLTNTPLKSGQPVLTSPHTSRTGPETGLKPGPTPPTEHLFMPGMPRSTVDLAGAAAGVVRAASSQSFSPLSAINLDILDLTRTRRSSSVSLVAFFFDIGQSPCTHAYTAAWPRFGMQIHRRRSRAQQAPSTGHKGPQHPRDETPDWHEEECLMWP
ncbi:L-arabinose-binding periplasmic protein [Dissostichus eleginoides]|uniref:L-arabinose-binding periplasmic protein n=1 Tax=Dissostichus eleginoides TaxID=100907 RepID=A0AAD9FFR3_DISEL|nr:L-arabinose-binding periplasmic protein [Dissostichus eleginoides]